ncbi:DUF3267 domain-containing protein [Bacillus sp. CGMCC 1.16607]|uniref:DUF3267 domain-containing protein n=1 Tax=Bacillus sp. CGMCC 1.16607 TaxID=3351842 RepID=UPI003628F00E
MNCWRTINIAKQYGSQRLFILSSLTMLFSFIILYVPVTYLTELPLKSNYFFLLLLSIFFLYPIHKLFHYLPIAHLGERVNKSFEMYGSILPIIHIRVHEPIRKWTFLLALFFPFIIIGLLISFGFIFFPNYSHYFTILLSFHIGLCVSDFIRAKNILFAPNHSFIEENDEGFEILVFKSVS